jgi:hypothetical protein
MKTRKSKLASGGDKADEHIEMSLTRRPSLSSKLLPPRPFVECGAPDDRVGPTFQLRFSRPVVPARSVPPSEEPNGQPPQWEAIYPFQCAQARTRVSPGLTLGIVQTWNLQRLSIGDLSSNIGLAPGETLTVELTQSTRKRLEQDTVDSTEELTSSESTTSDKEAVNVARSASKSENWRVDGQGSFSLGFVKLGAGANYSKTLSESSQQSVSHIHEATQKSAHSLKALHKIEVKGTTETFIQNRMTRVIKNPYLDRTLSVNVFQLIKHFCIETRLDEVRFAWVIDVDGMKFDDHFVLGQTAFLRDNLLEPTLVDLLDQASQGAKPPPSSRAISQTIHQAQRALEILFREAHGIFNIPSIRLGLANPNDPASSFNAQLFTIPDHQPDDRALGNASGFVDAINNSLGLVFTTLGTYFRAYGLARHDTSNQPVDPKADPGDASTNPFVVLATSLAAAITPAWSALDPKSNEVKNILDAADYTEVFRRVSGFLALVTGIVQPLLQLAQAEEQARAKWSDAQQPLAQLLQHLSCNESYYVQKFLAYAADKTNNQALVDFVERVLPATTINGSARLVDTQRAYVDRNQVVVPGIAPLTDDQINQLLAGVSAPNDALFSLAGVDAEVIPDLEVAADGIHLEVAAGCCVLEGIPGVA